MHVKTNEPIAPYTNYRIGGPAREVYFPETAEECNDLFRSLHSSKTPYYILSGGTNVLVGDGFWDGAVIVMSNLKTYSVAGDALTCGAGLESSKAAEIARDNGKTGLEFLYLLPGTIGGGIAGNARYGNINVSDVLIELTACHPDHSIRRFAKDEIEFAYKYTSITAMGWIILEAVLRWSDSDRALIEERMRAIEIKRNESHHFDYPSAGCMFKNDHARNIQVGRLLDSLGLKGTRIGDAEVAPFHANFIINRGHATARDVVALLEKIEDMVRDRTGVALEREVRLAGTFI
jgi:UDP-N-acetylmuramate dehydrogenase